MSEQQTLEQNGAREEYRQDLPVLTPPVDLIDEDERIVILADLPGVDPESLDVTWQQGVLTFRGTRRAAVSEDHALAWSEFQGAVFQRAFRLGDEVDANGIQANMNGGVLRLVLPRVRPSQTKIQVQSE